LEAAVFHATNLSFFAPAMALDALGDPVNLAVCCANPHQHGDCQSQQEEGDG
jgi:hypothetical protein